MIYVPPDTREYPDALCAVCGRQYILKYRSGYNDHVCSEPCAKLDCFANETSGTVRMFPLQSHEAPKKIPESVYMAAYRVYSKVYGPQPAMIDLEGRNCRGGFGMLEFIAFLYASGFPESEWTRRVDECFENDGGVES